jgi:AcrR family transcriptional regulator
MAAKLTAERRRLTREERRATIVEAAGRLFGERGYEGARLDQIAAAAGVTKPILYRHFADKQALYMSLLERHREDLGSFLAAFPDEGSDTQRLRSVVELWVAYVESHSYAWQMIFRDSGGGPRVRKLRREVNDRAREVLVEIIRSQSRVPIRRRELEPLAQLISQGMASVVLWWHDNPGTARAAIVDAITRVWAGLLFGRVRPPH